MEETQERIEEQTREQAPKTRQVRRRRWSDLELGMFALAVLLAFFMTVSGLVRLSHLFSKHTDTENTTTVTRGEDGTEETPENGEGTENTGTQTPVTDSSLTQFASDTGYGGQIYALLEDHPEAAYVLRNIDLYPEELLQFVIRYPQAMPFAAAYPDFDRMGVRQEIDLSAEGRQDTVPLLIQWDTRWGYETYGGNLLGCSGCGPTCLSMVSLYLNGWHDNDPVTIAKFAEENGYYVSGSGSAWTLMSQACVNFGLNSKELPLDENKIIAALDEGKPVICAMGPGIFTDGGHYIVITGYNDSGFIIRDPNSPENSARIWTFDEIKDQIKNLWSFEAA